MRSALLAATAASIAAHLLLAPAPAFGLIEPFEPTFIISDEEYNDAAAMSCEQIQAFLNERTGILKGYVDEEQTAAQIICMYAQAFSINPRLLLVLAQKEQGLLTDSTPSDYAINWALGCGPGWARTKGFATQVECAARTLRRNYDRGGVGEVIDGITSTNRGTQALYRYTNHQWGNIDLFKIWTRYFPSSAFSGIPPEIVVDSRKVELTPPIKGDPTCRYGWAIGRKARGGHHVATPNVASAAESTNKAVWRPYIPREGAYRVMVFVPNRAPIVWPCAELEATLDTTDARYTIKHRDGVTSYAINQEPIHDDWVDLGTYYFSAGTDNTVTLDDVTGEPANSRWISIDDMKFVWVQP